LTALLQQAAALDPVDEGEALARAWLQALLESGERASSDVDRKEVSEKTK
jgi:hypothetical protein